MHKMQSGYNLIDGSFLWKLHATHGVAIEIILPELANKKYIPTWDTLFLSAKKDGTDLRRLADRVCMAVHDSYPEEVSSIITSRLPSLLKKILS